MIGEEEVNILIKAIEKRIKEIEGSDKLREEKEVLKNWVATYKKLMRDVKKCCELSDKPAAKGEA